MSLFSRCKECIEFLPLALIMILFLSEKEYENHAVRLSWQMAGMAVTLIFFFLLILYFEINKVTSFILAMFLWILLVVIKRKYIIPV